MLPQTHKEELQELLRLIEYERIYWWKMYNEEEIYMTIDFDFFFIRNPIVRDMYLKADHIISKINKKNPE